jgi:hypothetical protein
MKKSHEQMKKIIMENSEFIKDIQIDEEFFLAEIDKSLESVTEEKTKDILKK